MHIQAQAQTGTQEGCSVAEPPAPSLQMQYYITDATLIW